MMNKSLKAMVLGGLVGVVSAAERPNVVLIVCDDLNDYITGIQGQAGHPQTLTPHMEKLASSGVAFRRAYSNHPVCAPSRSSFLTGIYGHTSGNLFWNKWFQNPVLKNSRSLMDHFKQNGYHVVGSGKMMHHGKPDEWSEFKYKADYGPMAYDGEKRVAHPGVPKPFWDIGSVDGSWGALEDIPYADEDKPGSGWIYGDWSKLKRFNPETDLTPDEMNAEWAVNQIESFSKQDGDQPFFLGVGFIRPHTPLHVAKKYFEMFPLDELEMPLIKDGDADDTHYREIFDPGHKGLRYYKTLMDSYDGDKERAIKTFTQAYLACVAAVDECIGDVVEAIDNSPYKDNTIIVVTSDHGWQMGQKDYLFKNSPWEESCRVPLVVRAPGVAKAGRVAEHPVSLIDLYPTLVDLCGLPKETRKNKNGAPLDGYSVRPFLENPQSRTWEGPEGALSMIYVGELNKGFSSEDKNMLKNQHWSYRTERWRYIRYFDGVEELYDHESDPREWTNLAGSPEHAAIKKKLHQQILEITGPLDRKTPTQQTVSSKPKKKWNWFGTLDTNKDGIVTEGEWLTWNKKSAVKKGDSFNEAKQKEYFAARDANGDGQLTRKELEESLK
ncbi:Arylsulfatase [Pontiella desulfatans]|uniref:Arylsulfatase n=1 Tax=Pontiella desulfatans TaxID=2750659 RepID=A0A6C2UAQ1_PONDE|nr:sulfatase-like hydrolase/transferase [Pontiella desulfatans]SPS74059.1 sulfatase S1_7 [Kiritimatiellales bacterium]VGO16444.1 Arylsulfatase [Pontiella desulfatans]